MVDLNTFLDEIMMFQVSNSEFHLYIGSLEEPRSTIVIIRGNRIEAPVRVPPLSKDVLIQRYSQSEIDIKRLNPKILILLRLLKLVDSNVIEEDEDDEISEEIILVKDWKDFNVVEFEEKQIVPITESISELLSDPSSHEDLFLDFIDLISNYQRNKRQVALMNILKQPSVSECLIFYLFWVREEITIAIIRELGRQGKRLDFILDSCVNLINSGDKTYLKFAKAYLDQFEFDHPDLDQLKKNDMYDLNNYYKLSPKKRIYSILPKLQSVNAETTETFQNFILVYQHGEFDFEVKNLFFTLNLRKVDKKALMVAIMELFHYGETRSSPKLLAFSLGVCSLYDEIKYQDEFEYRTELTETFQHVANRVLSILYLWKSLKQTSKIHEFIQYFLSFVPKPRKFENTTEDQELGSIWIKNHYILSNYQKEVTKVLKTKNWIFDIAYHQGILDNNIVLDLIEPYLDNEKIPKLSLEKKVVLSYKYPKFKKLSDTVENGLLISDKFFEIVYPDLSILKALSANKLFLSNDMYQYFVKEILVSGQSSFYLLQEYLQMISIIEKPQLEHYFILTEEIVLKKFDYENIESPLKQFIIQIIIDWAKITSTFLTERIQSTVDTFKIIFQQDIEEFDLESSKPLAIETIAECYTLTNGEIPKFVESNIQFSFTKPVWDQLARHYLALGVSRPKREAIANSKLKEVPNYLLRDVLGQIALVNQTLNYCERNGFREPLENLIINNMYRRGWNVERGLERTIPSYFGSFSPRLRAYFSAYLVIEQGEISLDILLWARDVEDYLIRDRIVRELERYGTPDMWVVLANSYHEDIQSRSIQQIKESRMSSSDRSKIIVKLLSSPRKNVYDLGIQWLENHGVQQEELGSLFLIENPKIIDQILNYLLDNTSHLNQDHEDLIYNLVLKLMWKPSISKHTIEKLSKLSKFVSDATKREFLKSQILEKMSALSSSQISTAITQLSYLE